MERIMIKLIELTWNFFLNLDTITFLLKNLDIKIDVFNFFKKIVKFLVLITGSMK